MAISNYTLKLFDCLGGYAFNLQDVLSLEFEKIRNDIGVCTIVLVGNSYNINDFVVDMRLEIYRNNSKSQNILQFNTCWFLQKIEFELNGACEQVLTLTFFDTVSLLARRIVAWQEVLLSNYPSVIREKLDDIISLIFFYNFNAGTVSPTAANAGITGFTPAGVFAAVPAIASFQLLPYAGNLVNRQVPITFATPQSKSTITTETHKFSGVNCLTAMQEIAESASLQGEQIHFDILYTPATTANAASFEFRVWVGTRGVDRTLTSNRLIFSPYYKNVSNLKVTKDYTDYFNVGFIGGNGEIDQKSWGGNVASGYTNICTFGYREGYETSQSGSGTAIHNEADILADVNILLAQHRPIESLTGTIINAPPTLFGEQYNFADLVVVGFPGYERSISIDQVKISVDSGGETYDIPFSVT